MNDDEGVIADDGEQGDEGRQGPMLVPVALASLLGKRSVDGTMSISVLADGRWISGEACSQVRYLQAMADGIEDHGTGNSAEAVAGVLRRLAENQADDGGEDRVEDEVLYLIDAATLDGGQIVPFTSPVAVFISRISAAALGRVRQQEA